MKKLKCSHSGMARLLWIFAFVLISYDLSFGQSPKVNFNGTWVLNEAKSQPGNGPGRRAASRMVITQDANTIINERTMTRQSGETVTMKDTYNFDGSETDNSSENRQKKSKAAWDSNGESFTVNSVTVFSRDGNSMEIKTTEIYKLSPDGNTLTIENNTSSQRGDFKTVLVYDISK